MRNKLLFTSLTYFTINTNFMKQYIFMGIASLITVASYSQLSISGSFNFSEPGLYYTVGPEYTWVHHRLGGGLNINQGYSPGYSDQIKWNLKPHDLNEYFGLNFFYNYVFYPNNSAIEPFLFADLNYQYCGQRIPVGYVSYWQNEIAPDPINTFTETMGFGFSAQIYKQLYLNMKAGAGLSQQNRFNDFTFSGVNFTYKASVGLTYRLSEIKKD